MQGAGQLPVESLCNLHHLTLVLDANDQTQRAEHLFSKRLVDKPGLPGGRIEVGRCIPHVACRRHQLGDAFCTGDTIPAVAISVGNAVGQHGLHAGGFQCLRRGIGKYVGIRPVNQNGNPRIGAELPGAHRHQARPSGANLAAPTCNCGRQQEHRVDRSQLAKERNGIGALGAKIEKHAAPGQ